MRRIDPRARLLAVAAAAVVLSALQKTSALGWALVGMVMLAVSARVHLGPMLARLLPFNLLVLLLAILLPLGAMGESVYRWGLLQWNPEGLELAGKIALKGNAILLGLLLLVGTMELATVGHALDHLGVPPKLAQLLIFTVRYLEVLYRQYDRLRASMKVRGFHAALNLHTLRTYGVLVGMLLVCAWDRSERVLAAMQCRGFTGKFWLLEHFRYRWIDLWFGLGWLACLAGLIGLELCG
ncbi:MAG: cobalt ECF transporter T component CbiQ [Thermoguttaceae bacterium]|nr:cobalt ECF transporter T component CbiQ [Thermoguttaceae bacterium]MDW8036634.1 cobalt ECF transporter T component CbiQ [Thermoguttaceae bacterium]